jgi:flagellar biosynthesis/type III secretory pathway protein FliH
MRWTRVLAAVVISAACLAPVEAAAQGNGRGRENAPGQLKKQDNLDDYYRGYQQGLGEGERDARRNRPYDAAAPNNGRRAEDIQFRNGFADGYRDGFNQVRGNVRNDRQPDGILIPRDDRRPGGVYYPNDDRRDGAVVRRSPGGYQEPALARGYSDGYEDGLNDGHDRNRYDPVGEKDYRNADKGYYGGYGSKDAYKNNYRAGFRQGYEDGFREGGLRRR